MRFQHLALLMSLELLLIGIAFPDATQLLGDVILFLIVAPLQFFNRYLGLKLTGERPQVIRLYTHIFIVVMLVWAIREFSPGVRATDAGISVVVYSALAAISCVVLVRIVSKIWRNHTINSDVLFGIIICYATLILISFELHAINNQLQPGSYDFVAGMKEHSQLLFLSIGSTTTLSGPIAVNNTTGQLINYFQSYLSQIFLVVFVSRMIGLHTGRS